MIDNFQYYPMGFRRPLSNYPDTRNEADREVVELYNMMFSGDRYAYGWDYDSRILEAAIRLLPDVSQFVLAQVDNKRLTLNAKDFINDTVHYIQTGRRKIQPQLRYSIMCSEVNAAPRPNYVQERKPAEIQPLPIAGPDALVQWARHRDGLFDMLCSLNILFGERPS